MKRSRSSRAAVVVAAFVISSVVAGWSTWRMLEVRDSVESLLEERHELEKLTGEIRQLLEVQEKSRLQVLPENELKATIMSAVQRIQPSSGERTTIEIGPERRLAKLDFIRRQSDIRVGSVTLRECKELLNTLNAKLPSAVFAEIALQADGSPSVSQTEMWTLQLRLEEFRYAPTATKD